MFNHLYYAPKARAADSALSPGAPVPAQSSLPRPVRIGFADDARQALPARMFRLTFFLIGGTIVLFGWTLAPVTAYAGRCIDRREKYTFCLIAAGLNCMHIPVGTILGVFTLIVLTRDSVRQLFKTKS
jgi:hypothetical protein